MSKAWWDSTQRLAKSRLREHSRPGLSRSQTCFGNFTKWKVLDFPVIIKYISVTVRASAHRNVTQFRSGVDRIPVWANTGTLSSCQRETMQRLNTERPFKFFLKILLCDTLSSDRKYKNQTCGWACICVSKRQSRFNKTIYSPQKRKVHSKESVLN